MTDDGRSGQMDTVAERRARETRREKFVRVIPPRVRAAAKALEIVGYGGSRERYEYTDEDALAISEFLREALDKAMAAFGVVPRVSQNLDPGAILETLREALDTSLRLAQTEISEESDRRLGDLRENLVSLQEKAISETEQAAFTVAAAEREAAEAAKQLLVEEKETRRGVREAALQRAQERVMAALDEATNAASPSKREGIASLLYKNDE